MPRLREKTVNGFTRQKTGGFTLAEAMMATVVLGIAAAGVLLPFTTGASIQAEGMRRTLSAGLASDLMEEIIAQPFDQIVTRYNGYSEPQGQLKDAAGLVFTNPLYAKFSRNAACVYVYLPQETAAVPPKFIRVTVRVYYNGREVATINRLVSK